ncbi:MAG: hypothetical protein VKJ04_06815 [Vampirovibrionales bacterium]|nr:hypothetical protein [Vampirovibrionales bacterium]
MGILKNNNVVLGVKLGLSAGCLLALSMPLLPGIQMDNAHAQVGPAPPPQKPATEPIGDKLKSFKKFFGAKDGSAEAAAGDTAQTQSDFDNPNSKQQSVPFTPDPRRPETWGNDPKRPDRVPQQTSPAAQEPAEAPKRPPLLSQPPLRGAKIEDPQVDPNRPPKQTLRLDNPANPLGYADAVAQLRKIDLLIKEKRLSEARSYLIPLRQWLIDCTEAHINLYNTLNKVPSGRSQAELEKQLALEFAMLRDRSIFELGLLHVEEKEYKKAVKELVEVIKSQPKSKIGILSYELLQEIGFTEKIQLDVSRAANVRKPASTQPVSRAGATEESTEEQPANSVDSVQPDLTEDATVGPAQ